MTNSSAPENTHHSKPLGVITGLGMAVPKQSVTNEHFASYLDTSDEWIRERTGIENRYWAEGESINDLILEASKKALAESGITAEQLDGIIVATSTAEHAFPSAACELQASLGAKKAFAYDLAAACSGFVYGLMTAKGHLSSGLAKNILLVGAEVFSKVIDKQDRGTCILFGDGAGAAVISSSAEEGRGMIAGELRSDGKLGEILYLKSRGEDAYINMQGRDVFKSAVRSLADISLEVLEKSGTNVDEIDWYVSHQANKRILSSVANHMKLPEEKVLLNVSQYGNTSAASIPILLAESAAAGKIKPGDLVMISAYGGGATWGAVLLRW